LSPNLGDAVFHGFARKTPARRGTAQTPSAASKSLIEFQDGPFAPVVASSTRQAALVPVPLWSAFLGVGSPMVPVEGYQAHLAKPVEATEHLATIASFAGQFDAHRREG
jgi:hypothetical protein